MTGVDSYRRAQRARELSFQRKGAGEFTGGHYREPRHGPFYCQQCDLEMVTADGLAHHRELRHEER